MVLDIQTHTLSLLQRQRFAEAEEQLRRLAAASSNDGPLHALHALCLAEIDQWLEAGDAARRAVAIDPQDAYCHWAFAMVRLVSHEFRKARVAAAKAVMLSPSDPDYLYVLARAEAGQQNWNEALAALEKGLGLEPEHYGCRQLRDQIEELRVGTGEGIDDFLQSLTHTPADAFDRAARIWAGLEEKSRSSEGGRHVSNAPHRKRAPGRALQRTAPRRARNNMVLAGVVVTVSVGVTALLTGAASVGLGAMIFGFVLLPLVGLFGVNRTGRAQQS